MSYRLRDRPWEDEGAVVVGYLDGKVRTKVLLLSGARGIFVLTWLQEKSMRERCLKFLDAIYLRYVRSRNLPQLTD